MGKHSGNSVRLHFLDSKITADGDCSHEIKRRLLLGRKVVANRDSILKSRGTRDQIANIHWIIKKAREFPQKSASLTILKPLTIWVTTNCGKFLKRWEYQTILPVSWETYAGQEATVRTRHGATDWFQIGKGVCKGCILSPCLFNFYAEYIMRNLGWMKDKLESRLPGEIS